MFIEHVCFSILFFPFVSNKFNMHFISFSFLLLNYESQAHKIQKQVKEKQKTKRTLLIQKNMTIVYDSNDHNKS